jgi:hypothetical protein
MKNASALSALLLWMVLVTSGRLYAASPPQDEPSGRLSDNRLLQISHVTAGRL